MFSSISDASPDSGTFLVNVIWGGGWAWVGIIHSRALRQSHRIIVSAFFFLFLLCNILQVIYQTQGSGVFPLISKHREVGWKNKAQRSFFNQL